MNIEKEINEVKKIALALTSNDKNTMQKLIDAEEQRLEKQRQQRRNAELKKAIKVDDTILTILNVEEVKHHDSFIARLTVRNIETRQLAVVYLKKDETFGQINYK